MRCRTRTFWRGFSHGVGGNKRSGETDIHILENGTLTAEMYVNEIILNVHVRTNAGAVVPDLILVDDNASAHRANITNRYHILRRQL
jgi:hypothetical protein